MDAGTNTSAGAGGPNLPPGFRFHPTDEELVVHYLKPKAQSDTLPVSIIAEVDLYKFDPWELPAKAVFGEQEWYFFSPRDRKYPNGARPNRAATSGYWKATGTDKPVLTAGGTQKVGVKKALVFYGGKPPKGVKTDWIMHEYRLATNKPVNHYNPAQKRGSLRLDDWVLCRIYKKQPNKAAAAAAEDRDREDDLIKRYVGRSSVAASTYAAPASHMIPHNAHHLFDEMLHPVNNVSSVSATSDLSIPPAKRTAMVPSMMFWNEDDDSAAASGGHVTGANSMAGVFNDQLQPGQLPPYQISGLNWY